MAVVITGKRATFAQLADQLLTKRASEVQRDAAVRALQRANPGMSGAVPKGTPLVVPELPNRRARADVGAVVGTGRLDRVGAVLTPLVPGVAELSTQARERAEQVAEDVRQFSDLVADAGLKRFLTKTRAAAAERRAREEAEQARTLAEALAAAAPRWAEVVARLEALAQRTG